MPIFPAARARLDVGPADVGRRLTIRSKGDGLGQPDRELVGVLDRWSGTLTDGILRMRKRDGNEVGVHVRDIIAMRVVPPEVSAYAMQRMATDGWKPLQTAELGEWLLRASEGATGRANSVRLAGPPPRGMASALKETVAWYEQRHLPPKLQVPRPSGLEDELDDAGWVGRRRSRFMVTSVSRLINATAEAARREDLDIAVAPEPNSEWYGLIPGFGRTSRAEYEHALSSVRPAAFVYCRDNRGELLGIAHATLQSPWCGATTIQTIRQSRRRGIATAVMARLAAWAQESHATNWYLQMFMDNAAALSFFERMGFTTHHEYEYRWPGDVPEPWPVNGER